MAVNPKSLENLRPYAKGEQGSLHTKKHPEGYLTPKLKALMKEIIEVPDPQKPAGKKIKMTIAQAIVWRRIFNATEGDDLAIERIFDRLDGKLASPSNGKGQNATTVIIHLGDKPGLLSPTETAVISHKRG